MDQNTIVTLGAVGTILAAIIGPVMAVVITIVWESVRRNREQRHSVFQTLMATRGHYADPGYSWAIRTIPLYFSKNPSVIQAHASYMDSVRFRPTPENEAMHQDENGRRQGLLISEIMKDLGYKGLTAAQIEAYTAQGLVDRDILFERALKALPIIAYNAERSANFGEIIANRVADNADANTPSR